MSSFFRNHGIDVVFFDFDGVIVDSEPILAAMEESLVRKCVKKWQNGIQKNLVGKDIASIYHYLDTSCGIKISFKDFKKKYIDMQKKAYKKTKISDNLCALLRFLHDQHIKMAIVSSTSKTLILDVLQKHNIESYFAKIFSSFSLGVAGKPNPDIYSLAISKMGTSSCKCIAIEDSFNGINASNQADIFTIHLAKSADIYDNNGVVQITDFIEIIRDFTLIVKTFTLYNFIKLLNHKDIKNIRFFIYQTTEQMINLSKEEKERIKLDKPYRYYFHKIHTHKPSLELVAKTLGDDFSTDLIAESDHWPRSINMHGSLFLKDYSGKFCNSLNRTRVTTNNSLQNHKRVLIFGPCIVFGVLSPDKNTIPSFLQRILNKNRERYNVYNFGQRSTSLYDNINTFLANDIYQNDIIIFFISPDEATHLRQLSLHQPISIAPFLDKANLKNYFIDEPTHCNSEANSLIAKIIHNNIQKMLSNESKKGKLLHSSNILSTSNTNLKNYIEYIKQIRINNSNNNGSIMMNCDPFTIGHLKLISTASKQVDSLYVFITEEERSLFSFEDRLIMAKKACQNMKNVKILGTGKYLSSYESIPKYFDKNNTSNFETINIANELEIFSKYIAPILHIKKRFMGEEPNDPLTREMNHQQAKILPRFGITVIEIPRFKNRHNNIISASQTRTALRNNNMPVVFDNIPIENIDIVKKHIKNFKTNTTHSSVKDFFTNNKKNSIVISSQSSSELVTKLSNKYIIKLFEDANYRNNFQKIHSHLPDMDKIDSIIGIGGGLPIDISKYLGYFHNKKVIAIPMVLSTNAFSTNKTAFCSNRIKETIPTKLPDEIIFDCDIISESNTFNMLGICDVLSIYTALFDWSISNEPIDKWSFQTAKALLEETFRLIDTYEDKIPTELIYAIVAQSGDITNIYGSGRPESGSEHIFAKQLEGMITLPHGIAVSIGVILMSFLQNNDPTKICIALKKIGIFKLIRSRYSSISKDLIKDALYSVKPRKDRITILNKLQTINIDGKNRLYDKALLFLEKQIWS